MLDLFLTLLNYQKNDQARALRRYCFGRVLEHKIIYTYGRRLKKLQLFQSQVHLIYIYRWIITLEKLHIELMEIYFCVLLHHLIMTKLVLIKNDFYLGNANLTVRRNRQVQKLVLIQHSASKK